MRLLPFCVYIDKEKMLLERLLLKKQYLEVGRVMATFGVKGGVKVDPWMNTPEDLTRLKKLYLNEGEKELVVASASTYKGIVRMEFEGIHSIDDASFLRRQTLFMNRDDYPLAPGSYFLQDLLNLKVVDVDTEQVYGELVDIIETAGGANRVYSIAAPNGKELLVPVIPQVIIETDLSTRVMKIRPLDGLFEGAEEILEEGE